MQVFASFPIVESTYQSVAAAAADTPMAHRMASTPTRFKITRLRLRRAPASFRRAAGVVVCSGLVSKARFMEPPCQLTSPAFSGPLTSPLLELGFTGSALHGTFAVGSCVYMR